MLNKNAFLNTHEILTKLYRAGQIFELIYYLKWLS